MPKKNREYKKGKPFRDFRKFVIVAEGEREDEYFRFFEGINRRIQIAIAPREQGKSSPNFFIERLTKYDNQEGLTPEDLIWFVLDVDKWERGEIDSLYQYCQQNVNCSIAISNPCFEIWLYFHFGDPTILKEETAQEFKNKLHTLVHGGYKRDVYALEIEKATKRSKVADKSPNNYFPEIRTTKIYKLTENMLSFLGRNWNG